MIASVMKCLSNFSGELKVGENVQDSSKPLNGIRVIEMEGIGPAPFCGMLLADLGAEVVRIERMSESGLGVAFPQRFDFLNRGKRSVVLDLKSDEGIATAVRLIGKADVLVEGFRPGVMEKMGLGPQAFDKSNPGLIYGRMTGWGQHGPRAHTAGHDLNYIALTGALDAIAGPDGAPGIPLNLVGDFAGGSLFLVMGVLSALVQARSTGKGCVVDAAIVDGTANLMTLMHAMQQMGIWEKERGQNLIDGGAPFYALYQSSEGLWMSVAAIEPKFYTALIAGLNLGAGTLPDQYDETEWPKLRSIFRKAFSQHPRKHWCNVFEGTDACFAPVLSMRDAVEDQHMVSWGCFQSIEEILMPSPAPRFGKDAGKITAIAPKRGADTQAILSQWGIVDDTDGSPSGENQQA